MPDLSIEIGTLRLRNPVMLASGTTGYGNEYAALVDLASVGAVVLKTVTLEPCEGNAPPRLRETEAGLLNAIGLENVGLSEFLDRKLPESAKIPAPLVASAGGRDAGEFAELTRELASRNEIAAVELNISCPNVRRARVPLWADPDRVAETVAAARAETDKPLLVKLSPNVADVVSVAEAAERAGADALVVANTLTGMRIDVEKRAPALGNVTGGLSGPALLPVNLALVWTVSSAVSLPLIGCGGISAASHVLEYLMAGATAVQVGTALFADPSAPARLASDLSGRMSEDGFDSIARYVGLARKGVDPAEALKEN